MVQESTNGWKHNKYADKKHGAKSTTSKYNKKTNKPFSKKNVSEKN